MAAQGPKYRLCRRIPDGGGQQAQGSADGRRGGNSDHRRPAAGRPGERGRPLPPASSSSAGPNSQGLGIDVVQRINRRRRITCIVTFATISLTYCSYLLIAPNSKI